MPVPRIGKAGPAAGMYPAVERIRRLSDPELSIPRISTGDIMKDIARSKQSANIHIVIIDDDPVTRKLLKSWLEPKYKSLYSLVSFLISV